MTRPSARLAALLLLALAACGPRPEAEPAQVPAYSGASPQMMRLIDDSAQDLGIPAELLHRVVQRESGYNAGARNGPYYGLMQIMPETARTMGFRGEPSQLLDAEENLRWAGAYLRGAWIVSDGDMDEAVRWYSQGYYYEARNRCLLVETGLRDTEVRC
jgi:soluble lytic murein transglycosylase-like protein